jgi:iron complex transport system substrate-binding protein
MKKKTFVLVGIAVCVLLLTSPALASAGYSKIYGNANEDDVLDMRDVTYIKLVIFGKKPATTLADANYDGKISMLDIGQTKLIILGKEKELTLVDMLDRIVTVPRPIERVVSSYVDATRLTIALDACDKLVGIKEYDPICLCSDGELCAAKVCGGRVYDGIPVVGGKCGKLNLNLEFTISLKPDVILGSLYVDSATANSVQEKTGIPVVCVESGGHSNKFEDMYESIELIGEVLEKGGEAEELISFINEKIAKVMKVTSQIPEEEKQRVYFARNSRTWWLGSGRSGRSYNYYRSL